MSAGERPDPAENPPPLSRDLSGDLLGLPGGRPLSQCSNPPAESCSDAGCPLHGYELSPTPDYEPDGTERPGIPRAVAGPPIDLGDDPDGDSTPDWLPSEAELAERAAERARAEAEHRAAWISGQREWLDILEANPGIPLPGRGETPEYPEIVYFGGENAREEMAAARQAIGGQWDKTVTDSWLELARTFSGFHVRLYAKRDAVCTRRVVGTEEREVEEEIRPAETRKVRKQVDIVEWDCAPILGGGESR